MKNYRIADLSVNMEVGGRTLEQSKPFLISEVPDENAKITLSGITQRVDFLMKNYVSEKSDPAVLEYIISGRRFYKALVDFNGFMLHASAVVYNGKAYLFSADSGVGKSTHTALWKNCFEGAYTLNDDKPAIRVFGDDFYVYGTPWNGKSTESVNQRVPLGGICFLYRNSKNVIRKLSTSEALRRLIRQTAHQRFKRDVLETIVLIWKRLLVKYPGYELGCLPNEEAAGLAYQTMKGE